MGSGCNQCGDDVKRGEAGHEGGAIKHAAGERSIRSFSFPGEPNGEKARALCVRRGRDGEFRHLEARTLEAAGEIGDVAGAGDGEQAARLQGFERGGHPAALIDPRAVARAGRRGVEMDEDGVEQSGVLDERLRAAVVFQSDAWLGEQRTVGNVGAVPVGNGGEWLGDDEVGAFLREFLRHGGEGVAKSETGEPDLRLAGRAERRAGEAGEFLLRGSGGGAADLLAVDEQGFAAVVLLKGKDVAVGELGFCESDSWFHGAWGGLRRAGLSG